MTRSNTTTCPFCPSWEHSPSTDIAVVQIFSYQVNNSGTSTNGSSTSRSANLLAESGYLIGHRGPTANEQKRQKLLLAQQQLLANAKTQETARLRGCALYLSRLLKPFWSSLVLTQIPLPKEALLLSRSSGGTGLKRNREGQLISGLSWTNIILQQMFNQYLAGGTPLVLLYLLTRSIPTYPVLIITWVSSFVILIQIFQMLRMRHRLFPPSASGTTWRLTGTAPAAMATVPTMST